MDTSRNRIYTCFHLNYSCLCKRKVEHIPYGWDELDIVGVVAQIINDQKVIIKVSGEVIPANDHRMIGFLRNKSYIGQTNISRREKVNQLKLNNARTFLREYLDVMTVPTDEDGLPNRGLDLSGIGIGDCCRKEKKMVWEIDRTRYITKNVVKS